MRRDCARGDVTSVLRTLLVLKWGRQCGRSEGEATVRGRSVDALDLHALAWSLG